MNIDEMPAGRELDALIAEKVMGLERCRKPHRGGDYYCYVTLGELGHGVECLRYSTDIAAAWEVVEKMHVALHPHGEYDVDKDENVWSGDWVADAEAYDPANTYFEVNTRLWTRAKTAPLAICRAALKVVGRT